MRRVVSPQPRNLVIVSFGNPFGNLLGRNRVDGIDPVDTAPYVSWAYATGYDGLDRPEAATDYQVDTTELTGPDCRYAWVGEW